MGLVVCAMYVDVICWIVDDLLHVLWAWVSKACMGKVDGDVVDGWCLVFFEFGGGFDVGKIVEVDEVEPTVTQFEVREGVALVVAIRSIVADSCSSTDDVGEVGDVVSVVEGERSTVREGDACCPRCNSSSCC